MSRISHKQQTHRATSHGIGKLLALFQLTRLGLVFSAISNIWLILLWDRHFHGNLTNQSLSPLSPLSKLSLPIALALTAGVAVGLYVFGMILNDLLDIRRDKIFAPDRPLPSGRIGLPPAIVLCVGALLIGLMCSVPLGMISTLLCLICALLVLLYDTAGKFVPSVGLVLLGLIRATHMFIASPQMAFGWPIWLTMTHVIFISLLAYQWERKRPRLRGVTVAVVLFGWIFWTLALIGVMAYRDGLSQGGLPWLWLGPVCTTLGFIAFGVWPALRLKKKTEAGNLLMKRGLLWLIVHDIGWLIAAGLWQQACLLGLLLIVAISSMQLVRWMKEATETVEQFEVEV